MFHGNPRLAPSPQEADLDAGVQGPAGHGGLSSAAPYTVAEMQKLRLGRGKSSLRESAPMNEAPPNTGGEGAKWGRVPGPPRPAAPLVPAGRAKQSLGVLRQDGCTWAARTTEPGPPPLAPSAQRGAARESSPALGRKGVPPCCPPQAGVELRKQGQSLLLLSLRGPRTRPSRTPPPPNIQEVQPRPHKGRGWLWPLERSHVAQSGRASRDLPTASPCSQGCLGSSAAGPPWRDCWLSRGGSGGGQRVGGHYTTGQAGRQAGGAGAAQGLSQKGLLRAGRVCPPPQPNSSASRSQPSAPSPFGRCPPPPPARSRGSFDPSPAAPPPDLSSTHRQGDEDVPAVGQGAAVGGDVEHALVGRRGPQAGRLENAGWGETHAWAGGHPREAAELAFPAPLPVPPGNPAASSQSSEPPFLLKLAKGLGSAPPEQGPKRHAAPSHTEAPSRHQGGEAGWGSPGVEPGSEQGGGPPHSSRPVPPLADGSEEMGFAGPVETQAMGGGFSSTAALPPPPTSSSWTPRPHRWASALRMPPPGPAGAAEEKAALRQGGDLSSPGGCQAQGL